MHKEFEDIYLPLRGFVKWFYVSSLQEYSFRRKRQYSCNETGALKLRGNSEINFDGAFSSCFMTTLLWVWGRRGSQGQRNVTRLSTSTCKPRLKWECARCILWCVKKRPQTDLIIRPPALQTKVASYVSCIISRKSLRVFSGKVLFKKLMKLDKVLLRHSSTSVVLSYTPSY